MELTDILLPNAVLAGAKATSKKRALQDASQLAENVYNLPSKEILAALQERENLGPTGMGHGVAIPHARLPEIDRVWGLFLRLDTPVDFDAVDRQPVDLVFVLFAPKGAVADHLKALALVSRTLRDENLCAKLRSTNDPSALYSILTDTQNAKAA